MRALLERLHASLRPPATAEMLDQASERLGRPLPPDLRELLAICDGFVLPELFSYEWLSLDDALREAAYLAGGALDFAAPLPVFRGPASPDRILLGTEPGLDGLLLWAPSDDSVQAAYPGVVSFLETLTRHRRPFWKRWFGDDYWDMRESLVPFADFEPAPHHSAHAPKLMERAAASSSKAEIAQLHALAASLLGREHAELLALLLDTPSRQVAVRTLERVGRADLITAELEAKRGFRDAVAARLRELDGELQPLEEDPLLVEVRRGEQWGLFRLHGDYPSRDVDRAAEAILARLELDRVGWRLSIDDATPVVLRDAAAVLATVDASQPSSALDLATPDSSLGLRLDRVDDGWAAELQSRERSARAVIDPSDLQRVVEELVTARRAPRSVDWQPIDDS